MNIFMSYTPDDDHDDTTQSAADAAAAAAAAPVTKAGEPLTAEQIDAKALAAFDSGLNVAEGTEAPKADADGVSDAVVLDDPDAVDDHAQPKAKPAAKPAPKADDQDDEKPEVDEAIEQEIKERALKGDSAERFRALANDSKRLREVESELPAIQALAEQAERWTAMAESTGGTPEQIGMAFGCVRAINSGNPAEMNQAFDALADQLRILGKALGRKIDATDPLEADATLLERVKKGEIGREEAERIVRAESDRKLAAEATTRNTQANERKTAAEKGIEAVRTMGNEIAAAEEEAHPGEGLARYQTKLQVLVPAIKIIQAKFAPSEWPAQVKALYEATPQPAVVKPVVKKTPSPVRPGNHAAHNMTTKPKNDEEAFDRGLEAAGTARG